jgi:hypothetical protein
MRNKQDKVVLLLNIKVGNKVYIGDSKCGKTLFPTLFNNKTT